MIRRWPSCGGFCYLKSYLYAIPYGGLATAVLGGMNLGHFDCIRNLLGDMYLLDTALSVFLEV